MTIGGYVRPRFEPVRDAFEELFDREWDIGSAFSVYAGDERVVHLYGGVLDARDASPQPYDGETIQLVASASKFAEALGVAWLVDRGYLSYDDRIADHWPEFARGGGDKRSVTVRQLMMHRAGLAAPDAKLGDAELFDVERLGEFLGRQRQTPELFVAERAGENWRREYPPPPQAYHAVTRGLYASELARRVDPANRTLARIIREEITEPLHLPFWIGLPESEEHRVSPIHVDPSNMLRALRPRGRQSLTDMSVTGPDPRYDLYDYEQEFLRQLVMQPSSLPQRTLNCITLSGVEPQAMGNHRLVRALELPSSNGVGAAWALAALAAFAMQGGRLGDTRVFQRERTMHDALEMADDYAVDAMMGTPVAWSQGGFARIAAQDDDETTTFGWGGAGGQMVRWVPSLGIACAYLTNTTGIRMAMNDPRANMLLARTIECAVRAGDRERGSAGEKDSAGAREDGSAGVETAS